jgi:hypothetical protein
MALALLGATDLPSTSTMIITIAVPDGSRRPQCERGESIHRGAPSIKGPSISPAGTTSSRSLSNTMFAACRLTAVTGIGHVGYEE